jgi:hypothetical protein
MAAAWPAVVAKLVEHVPVLMAATDGWDDGVVYDGEPVTGDAPTEYVTVGYVEGEDFGGSYEQTRNGEGGWQGALEESGTVRSELVSWTGDNDIPGMRARAFALVDAWEAWVSSDETLGVLGPSSISSLAVDVQPIQNANGSAQRLTVTLTYLARSA